MLFSIVVPVYNVEKYINECLESIIVQVEEFSGDCEVLLIDDGSTDLSGQICDQYQLEYPKFIKVYHNQNQGLLLTRRFGYRYAKGDYIINCDSDDVLEREMLENLSRAIYTYNQPDMILFNFNKYDGKNKSVAFSNIFSTSPVSEVSKADILTKFMLGYSVVSVWSGVCKKSCIDISANYSPYAWISNGEDSLQKIEQFKMSKSYVYINKPLYNYRIGVGMTGNFNENYYKGFTAIFERIKNIEKDIPDFERLMAVKVLSTAGRAVTQLRYDGNKNRRIHTQYLTNIQKDKFFRKYILDLSKVQNYIQKNHFILLLFLKYKLYFLINCALNFKNKFSEKEDNH